MISILIPCYDYNAYPLVSILEKQALILNIDFEIICIDDGSFSSKNEVNQKINHLTNCKFLEAKKNIGRIRNRILLASTAQYNWLIFVDVDTTPNNDFLKNYIELIDKSPLIFGGCRYEKSTVHHDNRLRYEFGKKREEINCDKRNKSPYKFVSSRNFMAEKEILFPILSSITNSSYGNDYIFGSILKTKKIEILHIDNEVKINEIEKNKIFIENTENALNNLLKNYKENKIKNHSITVLSAFIFLEKLMLKNLFLTVSGLLKNLIKNNLNSQKPNLFLFDIFRLTYLCEIKNS